MYNRNEVYIELTIIKLYIKQAIWDWVIEKLSIKLNIFKKAVYKG